MADNVHFVGGTDDQQAAIDAAHSALLAALPTAQSAASTGAGGFADWFGAADASTEAAVAAVYASALQTLQAQSFTYDLSDPVPSLLRDNVFLLFSQVSATAVEAQVWTNFWPNLYLSQAGAQQALALSILHEVVVSFEPQVFDLAQVADEASARALAAADAASALQCPFNYMYYLRQFLS